MNIWQFLEIEITKDISIIKSAYAKKVKQYKPEINPEGFQLVREAYDRALKYASGEIINFELNEFNKDPVNKSEENKSLDDITKKPSDAVFYLLDVLIKNEDDAIELLNEFKAKGLFDNLQFSEDFQEIFAINLLNFIPEHIHFICFAIDFFEWNEVNKRERNNSFYGISLSCLIRYTRPYFFLKHLYYLRSVGNKKEAKIKNLNWDECRAAKILINKGYSLKFYIISIIFPRVRKATFNFLNIIEKNFPQIIGLGLNLKAVSWWKNYRIEKIKKNISVGLIALIIILPNITKLYLFNHEKIANSVQSENIQNEKVQNENIPNKNENAQNDNFQNNLNIKNEYLTAVNTEPSSDSNTQLKIENLTEPSLFVINKVGNSENSIKLLSPGIVKLSNNEIISGDEVAKFAKKHAISIDKIVKKQLIHRLDLAHKTADNIDSINVTIKKFGIVKADQTSDLFVPILQLNIQIYRDGKILTNDFEYVYQTSSISYSWQEISKKPQLLEKMWKTAAVEISEEMVPFLY